ncbi:MAG: alanine dehydrogenase [Nitrospirota bacterium]
MIIGVPKEIKKEEYRVSITPSGVGELREEGHTVLIETAAGEGSGFSNEEYAAAGASITDRGTVFGSAELIVKVKEPLPEEFDLIRGGQAIFTYLHLAPNRPLIDLLLKKNVTAFAYETLAKDGILPLLAPMSEIAGRMAPLMGAYYLQKFRGGNGILPTGTVGVKPAKAVILGAGVVGSNAARVSIGLGMSTTVINRGTERLQRLDELHRGMISTLPSEPYVIREEIKSADVIIGAVLIPGGRAPVLITREMLRTMKKGSVIVDVSIDQGGCVETSRPTTHDNPVYEVDGIIHYTVANMPGAYPRTSTLALTNATFPYVRMLAKNGIDWAVREDSPLRSALNTFHGEITHKTLADSLSIH